MTVKKCEEILFSDGNSNHASSDVQHINFDIVCFFVKNFPDEINLFQKDRRSIKYTSTKNIHRNKYTILLRYSHSQSYYSKDLTTVIKQALKIVH